MRTEMEEQRAEKQQERRERRLRRRRRFRRHGRRAYIRSAYALPSLATLGNAICGFGSIYVSTLSPGRDWWTIMLANHRFAAAAYLVFAAMVFDALDGRLARFTRHTTDFGGQLDSLADVVSFGVAPAFLALQLFKAEGPQLIPIGLSRLIWAIGAMYASCALIRLAKFNVSNQHGEQHHFSFLGLPSPGAAGAVVAYILMQQELKQSGLERSALAMVLALPSVVLATGLLMVSNVRYPHLVNRYLRGKRSFARLIFVIALLLLFVTWHQYTLAIGTMIYALYGPASWLYLRTRRKFNAQSSPM
jgi:CDP-diacylglycerol--serine O-phosphatidyltransferase